MITLYELTKTEEGNVRGIGNSIEVETQEEAIALIEQRDALCPCYSIGQYPESWKAPARPRRRAEVTPAEVEGVKEEEE